MVITFGSLNVDAAFAMDAAPVAGQTVLATSYQIESGGKGANQAVSAARAGSTVVMVGAVGNDAFALVVLQNLDDAGVDTSRVRRVEAPTGCASIYVAADGNNQIAVAMGANAFARSAQVEADLLVPGAILLLQMESPVSEIETLLHRAAEAGVYSILNLAPAVRLDEAALRACSLLVVNEDEAEQVAGWLGCEADARAIATRLGTGVLRTLGGRGSEAFCDGQYHHVPALQIKPIDTTAAGDCFVGILAAGLDEGLSLPEAMRRATVGAGLACLRRGSQSSLPWKRDIDAGVRNAA